MTGRVDDGVGRVGCRRAMARRTGAGREGGIARDTLSTVQLAIEARALICSTFELCDEEVESVTQGIKAMGGARAHPFTAAVVAGMLHPFSASLLLAEGGLLRLLGWLGLRVLLWRLRFELRVLARMLLRLSGVYRFHAALQLWPTPRHKSRGGNLVADYGQDGSKRAWEVAAE